MKKIFLIFIAVICSLFIGIKGVDALENDSMLKTERIENVYAFHYRNGVLVSYGNLPFRYQNGKLAYCIDSSTIIGTDTYSSTDDWGMSGYSNDDKKKMELISYYGYGYEGHNTIKYYMATQELIWLFKDDFVKWTNDYSENSSQINVDKEKNEILKLVNKHYTLPSFASKEYKEKLGVTFSIMDTNNVLDNYNVTSDLKYTKNNSSLNVTANKIGTYTFKLNHKRNIENNTKVYYSSGIISQKMAVFGLNDINAEFKVLVDKVNLKIYKRDSKTKELIKEKGTIFKIKDINTNNYIESNLEVNSLGYAQIDLPKGKYEIEEVNASNGYVVNKEKKIIIIDENVPITNDAYEIDFYNENPKGKINVIKVDEDGNKLPGVTIGLFDENYNQINSLVTTLSDDIFSELSLGTYYLKELDTLNGYLLDDKYYKVEIKYKDDKTYVINEDIKIVNKKIKCDIVYITSSEGKTLSNVEINVYDSNDKLVFIGKTNKNGEVTINDLPYGKYYIKQVKVPKGYIISQDEYEFYVNDSTCIGYINVENEKTVMPITTTSLDKCLCMFFILSGFGIYNFVKKNN